MTGPWVAPILRQVKTASGRSTARTELAVSTPCSRSRPPFDRQHCKRELTFEVSEP